MLAVFTSPSTPARGARLNEWLGQSSSWCHVRLPLTRPEDLRVVWNDRSEGPSAPVRVYEGTASAPLFVVPKPWGNLLEEIQESGGNPRNVDGGVASAHKLACSVYHLKALQCLATRCHPCVRQAEFAAIFEDDVEFVAGVSPGSAATYPLLVHRAAQQATRLGVTKLQLAVQKMKRSRGHAPKCRDLPMQLPQQLVGGHGARLLSCETVYSDSHAYVVSQAHAVRIIDTWRTLVAADGRPVACVNPWRFPGLSSAGKGACADDPALMGAIFDACDALPANATGDAATSGAKRRRRKKKDQRRKKKEEMANEPGRCVGAVLASHNTSWSLRHGKADKYRASRLHGAAIHPGNKEAKFPAIERLVAHWSAKVKS
jgi:hypothetical protein